MIFLFLFSVMVDWILLQETKGIASIYKFSQISTPLNNLII